MAAVEVVTVQPTQAIHVVTTEDQPSTSTTTPLRFERKMGDTELSYFLPSRQTGVNDM